MLQGNYSKSTQIINDQLKNSYCKIRNLQSTKNKLFLQKYLLRSYRKFVPPQGPFSEHL